MSWKKVPLKKLCSIEKGKIGITKAIPGKYPLVVTADERKSHNEYHFKGNAVVIPLVSSTGHGHRSLKRIHFQSGKFAVGNILAAVISNDENVLRADYLFRFLSLNKEHELVSRMKGMANVSLPLNEIGKIEIPLPPIEEQIAFVNKYNELEADSSTLSSEFTRQLDLVKQLRQAFLREAMQGKLVAQNSLDIPISLELLREEKEKLIRNRRIKKRKEPIKKDKRASQIPPNWINCQLIDVLEILNGRAYKGNELLEKGTPVLRVGNFFTNNKWYYSNLALEDNKYCDNGDLLYAWSASFGPKIWDGGKAIYHYHIWKIEHTKYTHRKFLYYYFLDDTEKIKQNSRGVFMLHMTKEKMEKRYFPLPPLSEQQQIVSKLDQLMHYCDQLEESIKTSQLQNELLLQQVLREALEPKKEIKKAAVAKPSTKKPAGKVIQLKTRKCDPAERAILAGHIINQTNSENFGRVKFQKLLYLVEHHCHFDFDSNYKRKVAGPHASELIKEVESTLQRFRFYEIKQSQARNHKVNYTPLGAAPELDSYFIDNFKNEAQIIDEFLAKFRNKDMEQCEIVATLYAVWNNRIIRKQPVNDELLKEDFLNWDRQKVKYKNRLDGALEWMKKKDIIPTGWGKEIC